MDIVAQMLLDRVAALDRRLKEMERREAGGRIAARYKRSTTQSMINNATTIVDFATADYDTHAAVTTGASWKFTAPRTGYYLITTMFTFNAGTNWEAGELGILYLYKGGVSTVTIDFFTIQATMTGSTSMMLRGATELYLAAGEYIDLRVFHNYDSDLNSNGDAKTVWVTVSSR